MENIIETENTALEARPIEVITDEIIFYKKVGGSAILEIGKRLNEAKEQLAHGEWLSWLKENVELSETVAQRCMRLAKEYSNPSLVTDLGVSKALILLALPESERDEFTTQKHEVNGEEKTVNDMTKRELEQAIDQLKKKDRCIDDLNKDIDEFKAKIISLSAEIRELKDREPEVREVVDIEAQEALKKQIKKLETEKAKAEAAKEKAETAKKKAEEKLAAAQATAAQEDKVREDSVKILEQQNEDLRKQLALASNSELSIYKVHFEQAQKSFNELLSCIDRVKAAGDKETANKLERSLLALLETCSKAVE